MMVSNEMKSKLQQVGGYSVLKAIQSHQAKCSQELSFDKEDCFYMVSISTNKHYIEVLNPKTKVTGLVPSNKMELVPSSTPTKSPLRKHTTTMNVLAYVLNNCHKFKSEDLEACRGDPILILQDLDEHYYMAKLIGKLGAPGRILKENVEIKEDLSGSNEKKSNISSTNLKKNNSTGSQQRSEKLKPILSRRSDSTPNAQLSSPVDQLSDQLADWGILSSEVPVTSTEVIFNNSLNGNSIPLASIYITRAIPKEGKQYFELEVLYSDSTKNIVRCTSQHLQQLHLEILERYPVEAGLSGMERKLPYMPQFEKLEENVIIKELNNYFMELLNVSSQLAKCQILNEFFKGKRIQAPKVPKLSNYGQIKIKLQVNDDMMAFWLKGEDLQFKILKSKINERLGCLPKNLYYIHPQTNVKLPLDNENALNVAVDLNPAKLFLVAMC